MAGTDELTSQETADGFDGETTLVAPAAERLLTSARPRTSWTARARFVAVLVLVLFVHAALIAAFLLRDRHATMAVAQLEETPVEIIVETPKPELPKPPEPKPPEPKPPEPPRPKEDLSPALSAPRAPNEDHVKTDAKEAKSTAPTKMETPTLGQPQAAPAAAPPSPTAPSPPSKEEAKEEEDKSKPDAEALNKAAPKAAKSKQSKVKEAKTAPRRKSLSNAFAALAGAPNFGAMSFARPTPKTKIYGGTEDVRWMSEVEAMLEAKVQQLPRTAHWQAGGQVLICFHVDVSGRVTVKEWCQKSGYPDVDQLAMRALMAAAPFPPPPPGVEHGLVWSTQFDGQLPVLHISKR